MIADNQKGLMIEHFMKQVKAEDLLNIGFMKPIEVALRTNKNDKTVKPDSLPQGLMIATKQSINDNKFTLKKINPIGPEVRSLEQLRVNHLDNYISLLKKPEVKDEEVSMRQSRNILSRPSMTIEQSQRMSRTSYHEEPKHNGHEIGICISMCGQEKRILKRTLVGVADNIDKLTKSGVSPDDIVVVVVVDGLQNLDSSMFDYFEEFERESQIFIEEDQRLTLRKKYQNFGYHSEIDRDEPLNYSKFLFPAEQLQKRVQSKIQHVRQRYDEIMKIKKSIQNIKKQNNKDNDNLKMIVNRMADKQKALMKKINNNSTKENPVIINEQSIMKQLANSQQECNQYISTRESLAYISAYRLPTSSISYDCKYQNTNEPTRNTLVESQFDTERLMDQQLINRTSTQQQSAKIINKSISYVNLIFCIKYKPSGRLSSHNWYFNGFCPQFNPKYSVLLDVGVRPYPEAIFKMYRYMRMNDNVGSVCGYLRLIEEKLEDEEILKSEQHMDCLSSILTKLFDIQRAQQMDNHFDHIVEKNFESIFKFMHVLPSSFSAYNMAALRPVDQHDELLKSYFKSIDDKMVTNKVVPVEITPGGIAARIFLPKTLWKMIYPVDVDSEEQLLYNENTFISQDRILCLGIHKNNMDICFLPDVFAKVEPIRMVNQLIDEKKREFNGGMYSFEKVQEQFEDVESKRQNAFIGFQLFYLSFFKLLTFLAPALLVFTIQFATQIVQTQFLKDIFANESKDGLGAVIYATISNIIVFIYALAMLAIVFFSLHLNAKHKRFIYYSYLVSTVLGFFTILAVIVFVAESIVSIVNSSDGNNLRNTYIKALDTYVDHEISLIMVDLLRYFIYISLAMVIIPVLTFTIAFRKMGIIWDMFVGWISYVFYFPTYSCLIPIYSKCRLDDLPAGTGAKNQKVRETWKILKMIDLSKYFFWNVAIGASLLVLHGYVLIKFLLLLLLLVFYSLMSLIKWIPGLIYIIQYKCLVSGNALEVTDEQKDRNIANMKLRVLDTIKKFQDDFAFNIRQAFQSAAIDQQIKAIQKKTKIEQRQTIAPKTLNNPRNQSIQVANLLQMNNQTNLGTKIQNIRQSAALKGGFYPFQFAGKRQAKKQQQNVQLDLVLLKQKMANEGIKNVDLKEGEQKLKKYENFRNTIRPV